MLDLFKDIQLLPALISGTIVIIGITIQVITFFIKHNNSTKHNFKDVLKSKLDVVYSPLNVIFISSENEKYLINDETLDIIKHYGHLLPYESFNNLITLHGMESRPLLLKIVCY